MKARPHRGDAFTPPGIEDLGDVAQHHVDVVVAIPACPADIQPVVVPRAAGERRVEAAFGRHRLLVHTHKRRRDAQITVDKNRVTTS